MLKFNSCPPIIILMDVLFIFLFSTLLEKPPKIEVILPNTSFEGGEIILLSDDNNQQQYWYDRNRNNWRSLTEMGEAYKSNLYITKDCNEQCSKIRTFPTEGRLRIAIIGPLYKQIAGLTFVACNTDAYQCGNIRFTITPKGKINMQQLIKDNPIFLSIRGFESL